MAGYISHLRYVVDLPDHVVSLLLLHDVVQGVPGEGGLAVGGVQPHLTQRVGEAVTLRGPRVPV